MAERSSESKNETNKPNQTDTRRSQRLSPDKRRKDGERAIQPRPGGDQGNDAPGLVTQGIQGKLACEQWYSPHIRFIEVLLQAFTDSPGMWAAHNH